MALLFMDGFDTYAAADITKKWSGYSNVPTVNSTAARSGAQGLFISSNAINLYKSLTAGDNTIVWGAAVKWPGGFTYGADVPYVFIVQSGAGTNQLYVLNDSAGRLSVYRGGGTLLAGPGVALASNTWYYIELKSVVRTGTNGSFELKVNGASYLSASGINTAGAGSDGWGRIYLTWASFGAGLYYDDMYVLDGTGAVNNDFWGPVVVKTVVPDGAGNYTQMTASAGSNYQCVDDSPTMNNDTDYVSETTVGEKDTYTFGAIGLTGAIRGVQANIYVRSDGGGAETVSPLWRISGVDYEGTAQNISTSYVDLRQCYDVSPATASAWTVSEIDGAEFGQKLVS